MRSGRWLAALLISAAIACSKQYGDADTPAPPTTDDDNDAAPPKVTTPTDSGTSAVVDSGGAVDSGAQASTTCPSTPPTSTPPFTTPTSQPALPCTNTDLNLYLANEGKPYADQKTAMAAENVNCAACIFTKQSDTAWGPVVLTDDGRIYINFGLCYYEAGTHTDCAQDAFNFEWCRQKVCNVCLDGENPTDCLTDAQQHICATQFQASSTDCRSGDVSIINQFCGGSGNVVHEVCGPP